VQGWLPIRVQGLCEGALNHCTAPGLTLSCTCLSHGHGVPHGYLLWSRIGENTRVNMGIKMLNAQARLPEPAALPLYAGLSPS
jgi:hypothetical protein